MVGRTRKALRVEPLETRLVPAAPAFLFTVKEVDGLPTLIIRGTPLKDSVTLEYVRDDHVIEVSYQIGDVAGVQTTQIDATGLQQVWFKGLAGNDDLTNDLGYLTQVTGFITIAEGGAGNDTLAGGNWDDAFYGGAGNDLLIGNRGVDILNGGDGNDTLEGGGEFDFLEGGRGNDRLYGYYRYAELYSPSYEINGNDLDGGYGDDWLYGDAGNDSLYAWAGTDRLFSGLGRDIFDANATSLYMDVDFTKDTIYGAYERAPGEDVDPGKKIGVFQNADQVSIVGTSLHDNVELLVQNGELFVIARTSAQWALGLAADIYAFTAVEVPRIDYYGLAGHDSISNATDIPLHAFGGAGEDTLIGGSANDSLFGDQHDDVLYGASGNDELDGGAGADTVLGQSGNDSIVGRGGNDYLSGGTENDTIDGGAGMDKVVGFHFDPLAALPEDDDDMYDHMNDPDGDDSLVGGSGDDTILGGVGADVIEGRQGRDLIAGGVGIDIIEGGPQVDRILADLLDLLLDVDDDEIIAVPWWS